MRFQDDYSKRKSLQENSNVSVSVTVEITVWLIYLVIDCGLSVCLVVTVLD